MESPSPSGSSSHRMEEIPTTESLSGIRGGEEALFKRVLEKFETGTLRTPGGASPLHLVAAEGKAIDCGIFLKKFDINGTDDKGETPLFAAIYAKNMETTLFLIENGADVTRYTPSGQTPLHYAASRGTKEIVELLLSRGADLNADSSRGTPLHHAAASGNRETLECLLEHKADPNPTNASVDASPFFLATLVGSIECLELLVKSGADPNRACYLVTPLRFAATGRDLEVFRWLLKAGADPNKLDHVGRKPLEYAAWYGRRKMVELLYPVTSRIGCYPDWSVSGLMLHAISEEGKVLYNSNQKKIYLLTKAKGEEALKMDKYYDAVQWYKQAFGADPGDAKILYNKSLCYAMMNKGREALKDAQDCIALEPRWAKAHLREGEAWKLLKDYKKAAKAFSQALALDPRNKDINKELRAVRAELKKGSLWNMDL